MNARPNLLAGETLLSQPRQKRSLAKRERLKKAALTVLGEKGFEGASIEEIAGRAGLAIGTFYQHFSSKRQLLLVLMDELLDHLSRLELRPGASGDTRSRLRGLLSAAFSRDLHYLGAYRAWQEAALSDPELARKQKKIHEWTTSRVRAVFERLEQLPGARPGLDLNGLARAMDAFFWSLLAQAASMKPEELNQWIDSAAHLIYHALFFDAPARSRARKRSAPST